MSTLNSVAVGHLAILMVNTSLDSIVLELEEQSTGQNVEIADLIAIPSAAVMVAVIVALLEQDSDDVEEMRADLFQNG